MRTGYGFISFVVIAMLIACGTTLAQTPGRGLTALPERSVAPDFALRDLNGTIHRLSEYRGKVVIVNFWATWCPPCRDEMPSMQRAWEQLQNEGVVMLAVDVGEDEDRVFEFTANYPVEFPLLLDEESEAVGTWPVHGLPTTYVVDTEGRLAYRAIGGREWDDPALLKLVRGLIKQ